MKRSGAMLLCLLLAFSLRAATVTIRSDGKDASDPGQWTWTGTELGDQSDATYATTTKGNRILRSSIANDSSYSGCTINSVTVYVRAGQTTGNEQLDYGLYNAGTDYYTATPVTPPQNTFTDYSNIWNTRPWDTQPWTPSDIDNLVVAVIAQNNGKWVGEERVAEIWVVVDYTCAVCTHNQPTVDVINTVAKTGCRGDTLTYDFTVTNNCTASCGNETFNLSYSDGAANFSSSGPATVTLAPGATSATLTLTVDILAGAVGPNVTTITASLAGHPDGTNGEATTSVDLSPPASATFTGCTGSSTSQIDLSWTNPGDADFSAVLVVRGPAGGACPTFSPADGTTYATGPQGSDTIIYVGSGTSFSDTGLNAGTTYCYEIWAYDTCVNYVATPDSTSCSTQSPPATTTVGDGANPGNANLCPGDGATMLDSFTIQTDVGSDSVTAVQVTFAAGTSAGIGLVEITSDDGATLYGSQANPADVQAIALSTTIPVTTTLTQYKVRITPKTHAAMPVPPGSTYTVTGTVTDITCTNSKSLNDSASATLTIDNLSPSNATWGVVTPGNTQIVLNWTNPGDADFSEVIILRNTVSITDTPTEGATYVAGNAIGSSTVVYVGNGTTFTDTGLTNGQNYYYKIFARDTCGNYATGSQTGPHTPGDPAVTTGVPTANTDSCTQITISAPYTDDINDNSTTDFERRTNCSGAWTAVCSNVGGVSPRTCVDSGLSGGTDYCYRITFNDPDGVNGTNPQTIGPITTPACAANDTTIVQNSVNIDSCKQLTATEAFTGDANGDGSLQVEYNTADSWPGTVACGAVTGPSPRQCLITGLAGGTSYWVRFTTSDPDGVTGTNPEILGPFTTPACGADQDPPTILFLAPTEEAVVGGTDRVKAQVWDGDDPSPTVEWSVDGGGWSAATLNGNYGCGTNCGVYEFDWNTTALINGTHTLSVRATDATTNTATRSIPVTVNNVGGAPGGAGTLLRRTHGSQLCLDCHNLATHSSQWTGTKYGSWSVDCLRCHTPHDTTNIYLVRETVRTPSSGTKSVLFQQDDRSGGTNPQNSYLGAYTVDANATPTDDGICEVCHTKTNHYRNDTSGGDHNHNQSSRCVGCHKHDVGFKGAGCDGCHHAPPSVGKHAMHDEVGNVPSSYSDAASHATTTQYGFACAKCHSGTHTNDSHAGTNADPYQVEVVFDNTVDPKNPAGTYVQVYPDSIDQGTDTTKYWSWTSSVAGTDGRCTNLYCHSNASPIGGTNQYATVQWNQAGSTTCSSCHNTRAWDDAGGANTDLSANHGKHIAYNGETGTYSFKCDECHSGTIRNNPSDPWNLATSDLSDKSMHVNGAKDVAFSTTATAADNVDQSGGSYAGGVCSNIYCHSQGTTTTAPFTAPNTNLSWNTGTSQCDSCHGGNASAANKMATNAHAAHMNQAAYLGTNLACGRCHNATVSVGSDTTITTLANHVNGSRDVVFSDAGSYDGAFGCTNVYCHSNGTETTDYVNPPAWNSGTLANDCKQCHGTEGGSIAGEPRYANDTGSFDTRNSHAVGDHVSGASSCVKCHANTVDATGALTASGNHLNGSREVVNAIFISAYNEGTESCTNICHNNNVVVWGDSVSCRDCHMATGAGDQDVNDYTWDDLMNDGTGTIARIDGDDWSSYGHGNSTGFPSESQNAAPDFDSGGRDGCLYCHDASVMHNTANNPFRLANVGAGNSVALKNGVCTVCHGGAGYNPGSGLVDSSKDVDYYHAGTDHGTTGSRGMGGQLCWDCHDPHGDYNYGAGQPFGFMFQEEPVENHADAEGNTTGWGIPTQIASTPDFRRNRDGTDSWGWGDYVINNSGGVCQVCHDNTNHFLKTTNWGTDSTHFPGNRCTESCHKHRNVTFVQNEAFKPAGGTCKGCHGARAGSIPRAQIVGGTAGSEGDDFIRASRHVSDGTATEIVTNFDCIVCHAEGDVTSTTGNIKTNPTYHGADGGSTTVDLRDVDNNSSVAAAWPGKRLAAWSASTAQRDAMDSFCLGCHDSDTSSATANRGGAWDVAVNATDSGLDTGGAARRLTPFNTSDNQLNANEVDTDIRNARQNMGVLDVRGQFNYQNLAGKNWASHHNLNQFTKRYSTRNTSYWPNAAWTTYTTKEGQNIQTAGETAGLHCSDCHLNEVNAHGSRNTFYMLSDMNGNDTAFQNPGEVTGTEICFKCHNRSVYGGGNSDTGNSRVSAHNQNGARCSQWWSSAGKGGASLGSTSQIGGKSGTTALPCLTCHGGLNFGMIHGTNSTYNPWKSGTWTSKMYRFMGTGGSMRWYSPNKSTSGDDTSWEGTADGGCYTIGAADTYGGCTQHGGGTGTVSSNRSRPLQY